MKNIVQKIAYLLSFVFFMTVSSLNTEAAGILIYGDIDNDKEVTSTDAFEILQNVIGNIDLSDEQKKAADTDGDGDITSADALKVLQNVVGTTELNKIDISQYYGTWEYEDFTLDISADEDGTGIALTKIYNGRYTFYEKTDGMISSSYIKLDYTDNWNNKGYIELNFVNEHIYVNCVQTVASDVNQGYSLNISADFFKHEVNLNPAFQYIGMKVKDIVNMYGYDYSYEYFEGGYFFNYPSIENVWIHAGENATYDGAINYNDTVKYVIIFDGDIINGMSSGMTVEQIREETGLDISLYYVDMNSRYCADEYINGCNVRLEFSEDYVLLYVIVADNAYWLD